VHRDHRAQHGAGELDAYLATLRANPNDTTAMLGAATIYEAMYKAGEGEGKQYLLSAAGLLEQAIQADPSLKDVYLRLADLYINEVARPRLGRPPWRCSTKLPWSTPTTRGLPQAGFRAKVVG